MSTLKDNDTIFFYRYMDSWLLSLPVFLIITYVAKFYFQYFTRENPLPGPMPFPVIGNVIQMRGHPGKFAVAMQEKYGEIWEAYIGTERTIFLCRDDLIANMMSSSTKTNFFNRNNNEGLKEMGVHMEGIVFNRDMQVWRMNRKLLTHSIMPPNYLKEFVQVTQTIFNEVENYWEQLGLDLEIDIAQWMPRFTTDITVKTTTGKPFHSLLAYYNTQSSTKDNNIEVPISKLIESEELSHAIREWNRMLSAHSFSFVIYYICQNPYVKLQLEKEISQVFGNNLITKQYKITYEDIEKLVYTEAVIKEAARLTPVVPIITKETSHEEEIGGYKYKAGTKFGASFIGIHLSTRYWQDPKKFMPERFLKKVSDSNGTVRYEAGNNIKKNTYMPFGGGVRICPGRNVAMTEMKALTVLLFGRYDVRLVDPKAPLAYSFAPAIQCDELKLFIRPRKI
ncbi:12443_t:CDS:2 [Ambispora gerdemannii]|uniref:12443_t:CDS:1 n=1 Tax=Ambispora gerdemannii TaxID=144530 RepID=A0A9N9AHT4_9GLOM|nr:12443_t:CDS:2 [Ambispora gerdemannii]